jgi:hypothetical protein
MTKVSTRAVMARINRKLVKDEVRIRKCRPAKTWHYNDRGDYYTFAWRSNRLVLTHIDLAAYAKELGVLRPHEEIIEG